MNDKPKVQYTDISKTYDKHRFYSEDDIKTIIDFSGIKPGVDVLDLGCGTGNVASGLKKVIDINVVGIDISLPMLAVARNKSLDTVCADASRYHLPFRDGSFDAVIGGYVIHQIGNLESLFPECYRILRSGNIVLLTSSHRQIEHQHPVIKQFFPGLIDIDKARFPDIPVVVRQLNAAGFTDTGHEVIGIEKIPLDDTYLEKVKGKYVSTYHLLPHREFEAGVANLETYINNLRQPEYREWRGTLIYARKQAET